MVDTKKHCMTLKTRIPWELKYCGIRRSCRISSIDSRCPYRLYPAVVAGYVMLPSQGKGTKTSADMHIAEMDLPVRSMIGTRVSGQR